MQEQDGDRLDALRSTASATARADLVLVERDQHLALRVHALADLEAQVALDQRLVLAEKQIVGFGPVDAADLVDVAEALRGEQRAARAVRSRMVLIATVVPCRNSCAARNAAPALSTPVLDAVDQPRRRRQRLAELQLPGRLVERRDVGEGAADVGRQPDRA